MEIRKFAFSQSTSLRTSAVTKMQLNSAMHHTSELLFSTFCEVTLHTRGQLYLDTSNKKPEKTTVHLASDMNCSLAPFLSTILDLHYPSLLTQSLLPALGEREQATSFDKVRCSKGPYSDSWLLSTWVVRTWGFNSAAAPRHRWVISVGKP